MNLWKVRCEGAGVWVAFSSSRNIKRWFSTHAEAVAYADRMARTVEIVLPRPTENFLATHRSHIAEWLPLGDEPENPVVWTFVGDGRIYIKRIEPGDLTLGDLTPGEARKVALALLAAANRAEQEQPDGHV